MLIKTANGLIHCELFWPTIIFFAIHRRIIITSSSVKHHLYLFASKLYLSISLYSYFLDYKKLQNYYTHLGFCTFVIFINLLIFFFNI